MNPIYTALAARRVFVLYRLVPIEGKPGKFDKVPFDPFTLYDSNAQDPATWLLPAVALGVLPGVLPQMPHGGGIGIVIAEGSGLFCIDLDSCLVDGVPLPYVQPILDQFAGAYVERSVSGRGLHVLGNFTGPAPDHSTKNHELRAELYTRKRFIALSPEGSGDILTDHTSQLWAFAWSHFRRTALDAAGVDQAWTTDYDPACTITGSPYERIEALRRTRSLAAKFSASKVTFDDIHTMNVAKLSVAWPADLGSKSGLPYDASSVDQAYFNHLAYGFGNNCEAIREYALSEDCPIRREKWVDRPDYLQSTILKAAAIPKRWRPARPTYGPPAAPVAPLPPAGAPMQAPPPPIAPRPPAEAAGAPMAPAQAPPAPDRMPVEEVTGMRFIGASHMAEIFDGYTYVNDMHRIVSPDGFVMDKSKFDAHERFAKRQYVMTAASDKIETSAWEAFIQSEVSPGRKVRGALFDPRQPGGAIIEREGLQYVNTWREPVIDARPGDVEPFLRHLRILFVDHRLLLNYLKFMIQYKGVKAMWWPFLQGVPGNGKSFINATMRYCIGRPPLTAAPTAANLDSQFNAMLYGCLFLAIEDIKVAEDFGKIWETLKPMVTQTELEIQYKGVDKVTREVCFNAILNSNHKNGIRKDPDDRRIAPFFARQQRKPDLDRDGLTEQYFNGLWSWAIGGGWAHVAHYLATDPIDADFSHTKCPVTSSTAEHIRVSRSAAEQEILEAIRTQAPGFKGGWINMTRVNNLLDSRRFKASIATRRAMVEGLGYVPHPGLDDGQLPMPLADTTLPILLVLPDHTSIGVTDAAQIKALYEAANR